MTHEPEFRLGGVLRHVAAHDLKPGDAFESGGVRVIAVEHDEASAQVVYTYEGYDYGQYFTNSLNTEAEGLHLVRRRPGPWSPLIVLSLAARAGLHLDRLFQRYRVFARADQ
ncbi:MULTISPECIES: hypothetical protein [unclassified Microbacterium]|uniref:hypothetical protein n=1 Tax=unclassified Microbacterium TaxID=2609290 RepID=UPI002883424C|nr:MULTISPECIES: hypothetical protein [unclassified Microbacterium]